MHEIKLFNCRCAVVSDWYLYFFYPTLTLTFSILRGKLYLLPLINKYTPYNIPPVYIIIRIMQHVVYIHGYVTFYQASIAAKNCRPDIHTNNVECEDRVKATK